jgi:hypothetical protein
MPSNWKKNDTVARSFWTRVGVAFGLTLFAAVTYGAGQSSDAVKNTASAADTADDQKPGLNGTWKLNRDQSDDPREKLRSALQERDQNGAPGGMGRHGGMGGGGGMGGPMGGGIPGMGGPMGGSRGGMGRGSGSEEQHARLYDIVRGPDQVTVAQKGPETDLTDDESHVRALFTDGRKLEKPKKDSPQTQVKARWERQTLITEEKGPNGEKISHAYELSGDGKQQLSDTVTLESKRLNTTVIIRYVYDKAE